MTRLIIMFGVLLWGLVGCSTGPSQPPQWSTAESERYPTSRYLTGIGEAASREVAEQRALAALARVFEVRINEQSSDFSSFQQNTGQAPKSTNRQHSSRQLLAATEQQLEGAKPVEYWHDQQRHLVLAALELEGAAQRLRQQMAQFDQQVSNLNRYAANVQRNPVVRISALEQACQLQRQRSVLNRNLSVVSGNPIAAPVSLAMLEQQIRDQLAELSLQLTADAVLLPVLQHAVGQLGAQLGAQLPAAAELQLSARMDREPLVQRQGWFWLRGSLQLALSDTDGRVIAQQRWPVKISARQVGMIEQRLKDSINADIADRLYQLLSTSPLSIDR